jgi:hypothetical protein
VRLDLETRKKITEVTARRYRASGKKGKTKTLNEFCQTTGYNRRLAPALKRGQEAARNV